PPVDWRRDAGKGDVSPFARIRLYILGARAMVSGSSAAVSLLEHADYTDEAVVEHILNGDSALFELLMRRYNERLYRAARAITRDDREAEDVMQQAYVNAYTNLRQFNGQARFGTWLTRIAIN